MNFNGGMSENINPLAQTSFLVQPQIGRKGIRINKDKPMP